MPVYTVYDITIAYTGGAVGRHLVRASTSRLWCGFNAAVPGYAQYQVFCAYSDDEGVTWTAEQVTTIDIRQSITAIAIDSEDNLHIVYSGTGRAPLPTRWGIFYRKRTAGVWGAEETVALLDVAGIAQHEPTIAIDSSDDVHVVWYGTGWGIHPTYHQILYRKQTSGVWGAVEEVTSKNINLTYGEQYPAIAIDRDDNVHLVWESTHNPLNYTMSRYRQRIAAGWQAEEEINTNNDGYAVQPRIALDSADDVHVVWTDMLASEGWVAYNPKYRKRTAGVWGATEALVTIAWDQGLVHLTVALDQDDNVHAVWSGRGWGANPASENIQYRKRVPGGWEAQVAITDIAADNEWGAAIWANFPIISGFRTNIPLTGFAIVFWIDAPVEVDYYPSDDLSWRAAVARRKGNIIIDQLIYQHAERMRR